MTTQFRLPALMAALVLTFPAMAAAGDAPEAAPHGAWKTQLRLPPAQAASMRLERVSYEVEVFGALAATTVKQRWKNLGKAALRADYELAPPEDVSVHGLALAGRSRGVRQGRSATIRSGATRVKPGESVELDVSYSRELPIGDSGYELALDPVTAMADPTKMPGQPLASVVQREARIWFAPGQPVRLAIAGQPGVEMAEVGGATVVTLRPQWFQLSTGKAGVVAPVRVSFELGKRDEASMSVYAGAEHDGGRDMLVQVTPPADASAADGRPKHVSFILDRSGSMKAEDKMGAAIEAVSACLDRLDEVDQFQLIAFDDKQEVLAKKSVEADLVTVSLAKQWLEQITARGGTTLRGPLKTALMQKVPDTHHRIVILITDGMASDRKSIIKRIGLALDEARVFALGIGKVTAGPFLYKLTELGRGSVEAIKGASQIRGAVASLFERIEKPVAWDVEVNVKGAVLRSMRPARLPDLYGRRPVIGVLRTEGDMPSEVTLEAKTVKGELTLRQFIDPKSKGSRTVDQLGGRIGRRP